jgi:ActR/RegA family two-component response regulator
MMSAAEPLRCLLVDDSTAFLQTAARMLQRDGFTDVRTASTIAETLRCMEEFRPDVTLVDVYLGDESGFDLVEQLDRGGWCARSAVILTSTHDQQEFVEMIAASPAVGFLSKMAFSPRAIRDLVTARHGTDSAGSRGSPT